MTIKVFDTFTGTVDTDLDSHTPDTDIVGSGWSNVAAGTIVLDGLGAIKWGSANNESWIDTGSVGQWCTFNWNSGGADNRMAINLRRDAAARASRTSYQFVFKSGDTGAELRIDKIVAGEATTLVTEAFTSSTSTTYEHLCIVNGTTIEWYVDGILEASTTNGDITTGDNASIVHYAYADGAARMYDFQVDDAAPSSSATITSVGGDDVVLDAEQDAAFVTSGFTSEISTVQLVSGTSITNATGVTSTSGTGTFNLPDVSLYATPTVGAPLTSPSNPVVARLTDA